MKAKDTTQFTESPAAWFVMLEIARKRGDAAEVVRAQRELRRLGVDVRYLCKPTGPMAQGGQG